jgi:hypothetical protein
MIAGMILKTTKEWMLTFLCLLLLATQFMPQMAEFIYPIIDWKGGNRLSMEVDKKTYHCGEVVNARFAMQKQREAVGKIKWELVSSTNERQVVLYSARTVASPSSIIDRWAAVERLPEFCAPGQYHFRGTISYPVWLGTVIYTIRTTCFDVVQGGDK